MLTESKMRQLAESGYKKALDLDANTQINDWLFQWLLSEQIASFSTIKNQTRYSVSFGKNGALGLTKAPIEKTMETPSAMRVYNKYPTYISNVEYYSDTEVEEILRSFAQAVLADVIE